MTRVELRRWRRRTFPADTEKDGMKQAAKWYGVTLRAWEHWEQGTRPVPRPLAIRIKEVSNHTGRS